MRTRTCDRIPVLLRKIYMDLKNPASFSSPYHLYTKAKKINSKIKLWDVTDWLETQKSNTLHRQIKTKFRRRKVLTRGVQYQYQADLVNYSKLKRDNSGYTFVLSIIDCFSGLAFAIPIKRKTGEEVATALQRAFDHMGDPKKLHTDQGKEFYNQHVKELLQECGVHHFSTFQDVKAQIVERFNRTLREAILQYMTDLCDMWRHSLISCMATIIDPIQLFTHSPLCMSMRITSMQYTRFSTGIISAPNAKNINIR